MAISLQLFQNVPLDPWTPKSKNEKKKYPLCHVFPDSCGTYRINEPYLVLASQFSLCAEVFWGRAQAERGYRDVDVMCRSAGCRTVRAT